MKKWMTVLLALCLIFSLTACSSSEGTETTAAAQTEAQEDTQTAAETVAETVENTEAADSEGVSGDKPVV